MPEDANAPKPRVLLADDEVALREALGQVLTEEGLEVTMTGDGAEAFDLLQKRDYDLLLSDLRMPDLDGLELLKASKKIDSDIPFIFMTAYASSDTAIEALKLGAFDYITKPFQVEALKNLIKNALLARDLKHQVRVLERQRSEEDEMIGTSPAMLEIYKLIGTIAPPTPLPCASLSWTLSVNGTDEKGQAMHYSL